MGARARSGAAVLSKLHEHPAKGAELATSIVELVAVEGDKPVVKIGDRSVVARHIASISLVALRAAAGSGQEVVLVPASGKDSRPVIVGIVAADAPELDSVLGAASAPSELAATLDGKRVVLKAEDEIVLECGEASITLRRNGRVVIRGAYVETRSRGVNRIKGGTVRIN